MGIINTGICAICGCKLKKEKNSSEGWSSKIRAEMNLRSFLGNGTATVAAFNIGAIVNYIAPAKALARVGFA